MSQPAVGTKEFKTLDKGLLTFTPDTGVPEGYFADCQNMLLTNRAPITIGGLTKFNTTTCPSGNVVWFEPHTDTTGLTVMIVATDTGRIYKYNPTGDVWTELRRDFTTGELEWCSVPFRGALIIANSKPDPIMKYDAGGLRLLPVGAKSIADFEDAASWTIAGGSGGADTSEIREGLTSLTYSHTGASVISAEKVIAQLDLNTGLSGGPDFGGTDLIMFQMFVSDNAQIAGNVPQQQDTGTDAGTQSLRQTGAAGFYDRAFQFTANATFSVSAVRLDLQRLGTIPGTVTVEIHTDAAGLPSNTVVSNGTSVSIDHADIPTFQWTSTDFTFVTPPLLTSAVVYHIVVKGSWTPNSVDYLNIRQVTGAANLTANNTSGAPTTWAEEAAVDKHTNWALFSTTTGSVFLRLGTNATNYFQFTINTPLLTGWNRISVPRSANSSVGSPSIADIKFIRFETTSVGAVTVKYDDLYTKYKNAPPAGKFIEMYSQQLCVAGILADPVLLKYSEAGVIDHFPPDQEARFSGGRHALEKTDAITALYSYFDELIVGKVNSSWTFSGTGLNTSISALPNTIGIDDYHAIVETPWSLHFLFENNIFGARLTSRGLVSTNITSLLADIKAAQDVVNAVGVIRHDRTHTVRWTLRTNAASPSTQNDLGLIYDYILDAWCGRYTPKIRWITRAIVNGNRELLCAQYDGYIRRMDVGTTFDGTAIESYVTLPWTQHPEDSSDSHVGRWYNVTVYLKGTAAVNIDARFADEPHEFAAATFDTYGTVQATPDGDKGFAYLGKTARWMQLRLRATSLAFEVAPPIILGTAPTERRV